MREPRTLDECITALRAFDNAIQIGSSALGEASPERRIISPVDLARGLREYHKLKTALEDLKKKLIIKKSTLEDTIARYHDAISRNAQRMGQAYHRPTPRELPSVPVDNLAETVSAYASIVQSLQHHAFALKHSLSQHSRKQKLPAQMGHGRLPVLPPVRFSDGSNRPPLRRESAAALGPITEEHHAGAGPSSGVLRPNT